MCLESLVERRGDTFVSGMGIRRGKKKSYSSCQIDRNTRAENGAATG